MTANEYRAAIATLGMSQRGAARFLGVAERTSRRFALGEGVPWAIEALLKAMVARGVEPLECDFDSGRLPRAVAIMLHLMKLNRIDPNDIIQALRR